MRKEKISEKENFHGITEKNGKNNVEKWKKVLTSEKCHDIIYKLSDRDVRIAKTISFEFWKLKPNRGKWFRNLKNSKKFLTELLKHDSI